MLIFYDWNRSTYWSSYSRSSVRSSSIHSDHLYQKKKDQQHQKKKTPNSTSSSITKIGTEITTIMKNPYEIKDSDQEQSPIQNDRHSILFMEKEEKEHDANNPKRHNMNDQQIAEYEAQVKRAELI